MSLLNIDYLLIHDLIIVPYCAHEMVLAIEHAYEVAEDLGRRVCNAENWKIKPGGEEIHVELKKSHVSCWFARV